MSTNPELIRELQSLLVAALIKGLREPKPSTELLAVARSLVHYFGEPLEPSEAERKALQKLHKLHLRRLLEAVMDRQRPPSASMLAEARQTLASGAMQSLAMDSEAREAAVKLLKARVPFTSQ